MRHLRLMLLGLTAFIVKSSALKCYTCSYQISGTDRDKECVDKPWNVTQGQKEINCPYPYCVVFRQATRHQNKIQSFHRGCEMKGRGNTCVHDSYYSTCSYTCNTDLCNGGDGVPVASEVGQDVISTPRHVPVQPHRPKPSRPTGKPGRNRYDYNPHKYDHSQQYNRNAKYDDAKLANENHKINAGTENMDGGMGRGGKSEKKEKGKDRGEKGKNERRKGDCMHPYACDQSKYRPGNSAASLNFQFTVCLQSIFLSLFVYFQK